MIIINIRKLFWQQKLGADDDKYRCQIRSVIRKVSPILQTPRPLCTRADNTGLYNAIEDNSYIDLELSKYSEKCIAPSKDDKPNIASFLFSDGANVSVVAFAGVLYLELYMDDLSISFK